SNGPTRVPSAAAYLFVLLALLSWPASSPGQEPPKSEKKGPPADLAVTSLEPVEGYRGTLVKVTGKGFADATAIRVSVGDKEFNIPATKAGDTAFTFPVAGDVPLGPHVVRARFDFENGESAERVIPAPSKDHLFRVVALTPEKLKVSGIFPKVSYP